MNKIENENDITMNHIKGNWRYKVFRYKDKVYLLDGSTYWFSFALVLTNWIFMPIKAYEVNEVIIEDLKEEESAKFKGASWNTIFLIIFVSTMIAKVIEKITSRFYLGESFNIIYIYIIPVIFISYFTISRFMKKKKIINLLNGQYEEKRVRFRLSPEKNISKDLLFPIISAVIFLIIIGGFVIRSIVTKNSDVRDYIMYFLIFFIWFILGMSVTMRPEHLVGATVIIKDKERK